MGITYLNDTITVTGGSATDPYTMADLAASGTTSSYVSTGGYAGQKYTVSRDLVIGSTLADTYFDIFRSIIEMDPEKTLTVYNTALRGGNMGPTWGESASGYGAVPFIDEKTRKARIENIRQLFIERSFVLKSTTGTWDEQNGRGRGHKIVAVGANNVVSDCPKS